MYQPCILSLNDSRDIAMLLKFVKKQLKYGFDLFSIRINDHQLIQLGFWFGILNLLIALLQFSTGKHFSFIILFVVLGIISIIIAYVIWQHIQEKRKNPYITGQAVTPQNLGGVTA